MLGEIMVVQLAVVPGAGEDSLAVSSLPENVMVCVTDGCGGLGSRRYHRLDHCTGAYLAARLAARTLLGWTDDQPRVPSAPQDGFYQLLDLQLGSNVDPDLYQLSQELLNWTSILDCHISKTEFGLDIEIVAFPGEKLPKLPSAAKLVIRPYDPKSDEPFWYDPGVRWGEEMYHHTENGN